MKKEDQTKEIETLSEEKIQQELERVREEKFKQAVDKTNAFIKELEKEGFTLDSRIVLTRDKIVPDIFVRRIR